MVTMSGGTWLYTKPAMQVPIVLPCFCGGVHLFFCATISLSFLLAFLLVVVEGVVVAFDEASVWGLMAHGWVFEGMGLVSGRKETGLAVWCFVLSGSSTLCVVSLFGTHHPLCLPTSHSYQPPLDGVVRWCESTTVPLSISLFTVCVCVNGKRQEW